MYESEIVIIPLHEKRAAYIQESLQNKEEPAY